MRRRPILMGLLFIILPISNMSKKTIPVTFLCLTLVTFCFGQKKWHIDVGSGIVYSQMANVSDVYLPLQFEVAPIIRPTAYGGINFSINEKVGIYSRLEGLVTGTKTKNFGGYVNNPSLPLHSINITKYKYIGFALGGKYEVLDKTIFFAGTKLLSPINQAYKIKREDILNNGSLGGWGSETLRFLAEEKQGIDIGAEIGFYHYLWKGLYFNAHYFRGFIPISTITKENVNLYNQYLSFSLGYSFSL